MKLMVTDFRKVTASFYKNKEPVLLEDFNVKYIPGDFSCSFSCTLISGAELPNGPVVEATFVNGTYLLAYADGTIYRIDEK